MIGDLYKGDGLVAKDIEYSIESVSPKFEMTPSGKKIPSVKESDEIHFTMELSVDTRGQFHIIDKNLKKEYYFLIDRGSNGKYTGIITPKK